MPAPASTDPPDRDVPDQDATDGGRANDPTDGDEPTDGDGVDLLVDGELELVGRMPWSSNATFLCELIDPRTGETGGRAVYKPHAGERPLWDFPDGLYLREVAAYELAQAIGWDVVPRTVERDGPHGVGSVQRFVPADFEQHYFTMLDMPDLHDQLRRLCAFDYVANSTDRKGGHVLIDEDRRLWAIDNGLCLHAEFKLRTVIWDFADEPLPADLADDLCRFLDQTLPAGCRRPDRPLRTRRSAHPGRGPGRRGPLPHRPLRPPLPLAPRVAHLSAERVAPQREMPKGPRRQPGRTTFRQNASPPSAICQKVE